MENSVWKRCDALIITLIDGCVVFYRYTLGAGFSKTEYVFCMYIWDVFQ